MAIIVINPYQYAAPIGPSADPYSDYVSLLLHGNGTDGSTTFIDNSSHGHTVTANGDAEISTTQSKFGGSSMYFDGSGDYLATGPDSSLSLDSGDFTVEAFIYATNLSSQISVIASSRVVSSASDLYWAFSVTSTGQLEFQSRDTTQYYARSATSAITTNTWYHVAAVRQNNIITVYVNGVAGPTTVDDGGINLSESYVGVGIFNYPNFVFYFPGYIDDLRITKGVARYTSNFTPPTAELPDPSDPDFSDVSLLLHGDGNNGSTTFIDSSSNSHTVTANGNAQISTTQSKFGGSSMYFDGSGDYLEVPPSAGFDFDYGPFTVEAWIYLTANGTTAAGETYWPIVNKHSIYNTTTSTGNNTAWDFRYGPQVGNKLVFVNRIQASNFTQGVNVFTQFSTAVNLSLNTWYHVAAVRDGTTLKLFLNGQDVTDTNTGNYDWSTINMSLDTGSIGQNKVRVGRMLGGSNPGTVVWYAVGYIDDLRITKGVARYTANFNPPTAPLPDETIVTNGLALHLDAGNSASYPGSGTTWTDLSGNGNNGTLTNGPTYDSSDGGSIVFDGDNDYIDLGTIGVSHPLQLDNGLTISWWGIRGSGGDVFQRIIDKSNSGVAANGWGIYPRNTTTPESQLTLAYNGTDNIINSSTKISSTSWQNWSITWSSSSGQWIWYLNGSVDNSGSTTYNIPTVETNARIGTWNHSTAREYKGKISSVLIYTRPLTASEIAKNYNVLRDRYGL
jgi:hypothetical protein